MRPHDRDDLTDQRTILIERAQHLAVRRDVILARIARIDALLDPPSQTLEAGEHVA